MMGFTFDNEQDKYRSVHSAHTMRSFKFYFDFSTTVYKYALPPHL